MIQVSYMYTYYFTIAVKIHLASLNEKRSFNISVLQTDVFNDSHSKERRKKKFVFIFVSDVLFTAFQTVISNRIHLK